MGSKEHKQKVWEMISDIKVGMLVTTENGKPKARPMQIVQKDYDGRLWFFTEYDSEKVEDVIFEDAVCVTFSCPKSKTYVSLTGNAKITRNQQLIDSFWSPFVDAWFPKGKNSTNCALIEVKVEHGEHWDSDASSLRYLYEVAKANFTNVTPASSGLLEN